MWKKALFLIPLLFCTIFTWGQSINIGIFHSASIKKITINVEEGKYQLLCDSIEKAILTKGNSRTLLSHGNAVELWVNNSRIGIYSTIQLRPITRDGSLSYNPSYRSSKTRKYQGGCTLFSSHSKLTIVNNVDMDDYLCGVLESEAGGGRPLEYYKAQAVISRTYALKHKGRHKEQEFDLCASIHCQAYYHQLQYTPEIRKAVEATKGIYVIDTTNGEMIEGFFYANCGGETSPSDYVWNKRIDYLQPVIDTFCIHTFQAKWTKKIPKNKWKEYLVKNYYYPIEDTFWRARIYNFKQPFRKAFYLSPSLGIPLRNIRYHFHLKSTFFSCHPEGKYVVLNGRGFGHGVGLCQEGAMNMAKHGYTYKQILSFYYRGVGFQKEIKHYFFSQSSNQKRTTVPSSIQKGFF